MPALNERVPFTAPMWMLTWTSDEPIGERPDGRLRVTVWLTSAEAPETEMGAVSTFAREARTSASPSIETTSGLTVTDSTLKPVAGVPFTTGLTGSDFDSSWLPTRIFTWTLEGDSRTGATGSPRASTAIRSTDWSTETPDRSIRTWATASVTWLTTDSDPDTPTSVTSRTGSRT